MKRNHGWLLSILLLGAFLLPAAAAEESPLVLGLLEIRGLDSLARAGSALSAAAGIPNPPESIALMLHNVLGTMPGGGIPPDGTVRILAFANGTSRGGWAALLPVEDDGSEYLAGLARQGWKNETETADEIQHFIASEAPLVPWKDVYFLKRGATLVAARTAADVRRAEAARPGLPPILPAEGDVVVQICPAALAEAYGPQFAEQMSATFQNPQLPDQTAALGALYAQAYLAAAKQVKECVLGLGVADGNVNVHARVAPLPDTAFARWLATVQPPAAAANVVALPDALAAEIVNVGDLQHLLPAYFRFMEKMMALLPTGSDSAAIQKYLDDEKACYEQLAGDYGFALLPPTKEHPVRLAQYAALKDGAGVRGRLPDLIRGASEMMAAMAAESGEALPFQLDLALGEPREYRGIAIDQLTYAFRLDGTMAAIWPAAVPTTFAIELAWVPGGLLSGVGDAALTEALVDRALDGGGAPLTARPAWQALCPEPDARLVDTAHLALFDALRAYLGLADAADGGQRAQQVPDTAGNVATASYVFDGLMTRLRFSLADVAAASSKMKAAQAQARAEFQAQPAWDEMPVEAEEAGVAEEEDPAAADAPAVPEPADSEAPAAPPAE
ncbi:MAG: hypothetical protein AB7V22_10850 [Kiritimatiellia bacterium]